MLHASASRLIAARVGAPVGSRAARGDAAAGLGAPGSPPGGINRAQRACAGVQGRPRSAAGSSGGGSGGGGGSAGSSPRVSALQTLLAPVCVELQAGAAQPAGPSSTFFQQRCRARWLCITFASQSRSCARDAYVHMGRSRQQDPPSPERRRTEGRTGKPDCGSIDRSASSRSARVRRQAT